MAPSNGGKKGKSPETATRIGHLYQIAHSILESSGSGPQKLENLAKSVLSAHYSNLVVGVARKAVFRPSKDIKRTICKRCRGLILEAGFNSKKKAIKATCRRCGAAKNFPIKSLNKNGG